jgi:hypothetical protein
MQETPEVVATLLIRLPWDQEKINNWRAAPDSQSHPGDIGNLWLMKCYDSDLVLPNVEALQELGGVEDVIVVYGDSSWPEYAANHGITLGRHVCTKNGCKEFIGSAVLDEILYYTGPL